MFEKYLRKSDILSKISLLHRCSLNILLVKKTQLPGLSISRTLVEDGWILHKKLQQTNKILQSKYKQY